MVFPSSPVVLLCGHDIHCVRFMFPLVILISGLALSVLRAVGGHMSQHRLSSTVQVTVTQAKQDRDGALGASGGLSHMLHL